MPTTPSAQYSLTLRLEIDDRPGMLGKVASAIGEAGGTIGAVDLVQVQGTHTVRALPVATADASDWPGLSDAVDAIPGAHVRDATDRTFLLHVGGKIELRNKSPIKTRDDLSMAYTPGVARVCLAIHEDRDKAFQYTVKRNTVAVVSDGTAVLGLGNIGPHAALPVMEGKAMLFKEFAGIDAWPVCLRGDSADDLVEAVERLEPVYGGINLEDIAAPRCFEVEERLKASLDIPVFHDDQHGTAVVVLAALRNAMRVVGKEMADLSIVIGGAGAAGVAVAKILSEAGVGHIVGVDRKGAIFAGRGDTDVSKVWMGENTNSERRKGSMGEVLAGADVFIGVSGPGLVTRDQLAAMASKPIVFALANPDPEIAPEDAEGIAAVVATGRSDYPNQINNVLCFPGIFRGALDAGAVAITEPMKLAAAEAIAATVPSDELSPSYIVPSVFNKSVVAKVAQAVAEIARADDVVRDSPPGPLTPAG